MLSFPRRYRRDTSKVCHRRTQRVAHSVPLRHMQSLTVSSQWACRRRCGHHRRCPKMRPPHTTCVDIGARFGHLIVLVLTMLHLPTVTRAKVCEGAVSSIDGFAFMCKVSDTSFHTFDFESLYPPPTQIAEGGCNVIILFAPALQFNFDYKTAGMSIVSTFLPVQPRGAL